MLRLYNQIDIHTRAFELTLNPSLEKREGLWNCGNFIKLESLFSSKEKRSGDEFHYRSTPN